MANPLKTKKKSDKYVYPVDISEIAPHLREDAVKEDRSIHYLIKRILTTHYSDRMKKQLA